MSLETYTDLHEFFHERVGSVLNKRHIEASETTRAYLVGLLARYGHLNTEAGFEQPLGIQLAEALLIEDVLEKFRSVRKVGDAALYSRGFFSEYLERRGVSPSYVTVIGERAYQTASRLSQRSFGIIDARQSTVYDELGDRFDDFVLVLDEVRENTELRTPQDIVRIYDRWRRTGSPLLAERLQSVGVFPQIGDRNTIH